MHELSIVRHLVTVATEAAQRSQAVRVTSVRLRVGALSCVQREALEFCYEMVTEGTMLEGSRLTIVEVSVEVYCPACSVQSRLVSVQRFRCPRCDQPTADIRCGKELELESIEIEPSAESIPSSNAGTDELAAGERVSTAESSP